MKKKLLVILLSIFAATATLALSACGGSSNVDGPSADCKHENLIVVKEHKDATCTEDGHFMVKQCPTCESFFIGEDLKPIKDYELAMSLARIGGGHELTMVEMVAPADCVTDGMQAYNKCGKCEKLFSVDGTTEVTAESLVIKAGHVLNYVSSKEATCLDTGIKEHYKCSSCNKLFDYEDQSLEITADSVITTKKDHELIHTEAVTATCKNSGNIEYWYCNSCNYYYGDEGCTTKLDYDDCYIYQLSHEYKKVVVVQEAGCEVDEVKRYICVNGCKEGDWGHSYDETISNSATGHKFNGDVCENCGCDVFTQGLYLYTTGYGEDLYAVVGGLGESNAKGVLTIPNEYKGYPVQRVSLSSINFTGITKIVIPENVTHIYISQHYYSGSSDELTKIEINSSVIEEISISDLDGLTEIEFKDPNCVIHKIKSFRDLDSIETLTLKGDYTTIEGDAFKNNVKLKNLVLSDAITDIGYRAFENCHVLQTIPEFKNLKTIGTSAFENCKLLKEIYIPSSVEKIEHNAFMNCTKLEKVIIDNVKEFAKIDFDEFSNSTVVSPESNPLYYAHNLYRKTATGNEYYGNITLDSNVYDADYIKENTRINGFAFAGCNNVTKVVVPTGITAIGKQAFDNCKNLTEVELHNKNSRNNHTLTTVNVSAFANCTSLDSVSIANTMEYFASSAFKGCENITKVYYNGTNLTTPKWLAFTFEDLYSNPMWAGKATLYCGTITIPYSYGEVNSISLDPYSGLDDKQYDIRPAVTVSKYAFAGMNATILDLEYVSSIGDGAFYNASGVKGYVYLNEYVRNEIHNGRDTNFKGCTTIGKEAFYGCKNLDVVYLPSKGNSTIGDRAFAYSGIQHFGTNNGSVTFGQYVLEGCNEVSYFEAPYLAKNYSTTSDTGLDYFFGASIPNTLTTVKLHGKVRSGDLVGANNLKTVYVDSQTQLMDKSFGEGANQLGGFDLFFDGTLREYINSSVINDEAVFKDVKLYTREKIEGTVNSYEYKILKDLIIPEDVTIGYYEFAGITSIETVTITKKVTINNYAFYGCKNLLEVANLTMYPNYSGTVMETAKGSTSHGYVSYYAAAIYSIPLFTEEGYNNITRKVLRTHDGYVFALSDTIPSTATLVKYNGEGGDLVLPSVFIYNDANHDGYIEEGENDIGAVKYQNYNIAKNAFINNTDITSITFPVNELGKSTVEEIGVSAFENCYNLNKVVLQEGLKSIKDYAFRKTAIKTIVIPDSVTELGSYYEYGSTSYYRNSPFYGCNQLYQIVIGANSPYVQRLAEDRLVELIDRSGKYIGKTDTGADIIHNGASKIYEIDNFSFIKIDGKTIIIGYIGNDTEITLPDIGEDYVIGDYFLKDNLSITKVVISDDVTEIGYQAFANSKVQEVVIGSGVKKIASYAFESTPDLTIVKMGENVESIAGYAFAKTGAIEEFVLPASLKTIASYAFKESGIRKLIIKEGFTPTEISSSSFTLYDIQQVHVSTISTLLGIDMNNSSFFQNNPDEVRLYINGTLATEINITAEDGSIIPGSAFRKLQGIEKITVDGVSKIGHQAFMDVPALEVVIKNVDLIDGYAFQKYNTDLLSIESVVLENVKVVGNNAFYNNKALTSLTMTGVVEIDYDAFRETNVKNVVLPESIKIIRDGAFPSVSKITLVDGIEELGNAFSSANRTLYEGGYYLGTATNPYFALVGVDYSNTEIILHKDTKHVAGEAFSNLSNEATKIELNEGLISIGSQAFRYSLNSNITTITLPSTLKYIGEYAFADSELTSIVIPKNVERMGEGAFHNCGALTSVSFDKDSKLEVIPNSAFYYCGNLKEITLPNSVKVIEQYAFNRVESITFGSGLEFIEDRAFGESYDTMLANIYVPTIEAWLNVAMEDSFHSNANLYVGGELLTEVVIPETVKVIHAYAFYDNDNITKVVGSNSLETIEDYAFYSCGSLASVELKGAKYIGDQAFEYDSNLVKISAPNAVTIGEYAFCEIGSVTELTLGASLTEVGRNAFGISQTELANGSSIYFIGTPNDWAKVKYANEEANPLTGNESLDINLYFNGEKPTEITISTEIVGDYVFYNVPYIQKVTFEDTVKTIGKFAFFSADGLTTVDLGNVETIGDYAFSKNSNLTTVNGIENVKYICEEAFSYSGITSADLSSAIIIGEGAFYDASLESVIIGENFERIEAYAFECYGIGSVDFKFDIQELATKSFVSETSNPAYYANVVKFNGVDVPESVTLTAKEINSCTYVGIPIVNLTLDGVEVIGDSAFYKNNELITLVMSDSVVEIGEYAFCGSINLSSITLSKSITAIKKGTFYKNALTEVVIPDSVEVVEVDAFRIDGYTGSKENVTKVKKLHIGKNLRDIGNFFAYNYKVEEITIDSENKHFVIEDGILYDADKTKLIYCFDKAKVVVEVPTGVTSIEVSAFRDAKGIAVIVLPTTLTKINSYAFLNCYKLAEIINLSDIAISAGSYSNGYVGEYAENVVRSMDNKTYSVDENGFVTITISGVKNLVGYVGTETDITVPTTISKIYKYAFSGLELNSLTITNVNTTYESNAFTGLKVNSLSVPAGSLNYLTLSVDNLTINGGIITSKIYSTARDSIKTLTLGEDVTFNTNKSTVEAFYYAKSLKTVTINCSHVDDNTFKNCSSIETVNVGKNVKTFDSGAFYECKSIKTVNYEGTVDEWATITFNRTGSYSEGTNPLYYADYFYANGELVEGEVTINASTIGAYAFENFGGIYSVVLGDNVTTIGTRAFQDMPHLTHVTVGTNVATINTNAFDCDKIVDIYNKSGLEIIAHTDAYETDFGRLGYNAFRIYKNAYEKKITYNDGFAVIDYGQEKVLVDYYGTEQNIVIPEGITEISAIAFKGFKANYLEDYTTATLHVPASVTFVGERAFYGSTFANITFSEVKNWYTVDISSNYYLYVTSLADMTKDIMTDRSYYYDVERLNNENGFLTRQVGTDKVLIDYVGNDIPEGTITETTNVTLTVPNGVVEIGPAALGYFNNSEKLNIKIVMPSTLCRISKYAFISSDRITEIDLTTNSVNSLWYKSPNGYLGTKGTDVGSGVTNSHTSTATEMVKGSNYYYHLPSNDDRL